MGNELISAPVGPIRGGYHQSRGETLAIAKRMECAPENRIGILPEQTAEVTNAVAEFRQNEVFLDRRPGARQRIKLDGQSAAISHLRHVFVDFVIPQAE